MTQKELTSLLKYWLKALQVGNTWKVSAHFADEEMMQGNRGLNLIMPEDQTSEIFILDGDGEETLVHEILHILYDGDTPVEKNEYSVAHERAINHTAQALLKMKYKKK